VPGKSPKGNCCICSRTTSFVNFRYCRMDPWPAKAYSALWDAWSKCSNASAAYMCGCLTAGRTRSAFSKIRTGCLHKVEALQYHLVLYMRMSSKCVRQFYDPQQRLDSSTNNPFRLQDREKRLGNCKEFRHAVKGGPQKDYGAP